MPSFIQGPDGAMVEIEDLIIDESCHLRENQDRSVTVRGSQTRVTITSRINGSVTVEDLADVDVAGTVNGSLHVAPGSTVVVHGRQNGSVHVARGGTLKVAGGGVLAGSIHCDGELLNDGTRAGSESGSGSIVDGPSGRVRQPDRIGPNGEKYYHW